MLDVGLTYEDHGTWWLAVDSKEAWAWEFGRRVTRVGSQCASLKPLDCQYVITVGMLLERWGIGVRELDAAIDVWQADWKAGAHARGTAKLHRQEYNRGEPCLMPKTSSPAWKPAGSRQAGTSSAR